MALHHKHKPSGKEGQNIWRLSRQTEHLISFIIRHLAFFFTNLSEINSFNSLNTILDDF